MYLPYHATPKTTAAGFRIYHSSNLFDYWEVKRGLLSALHTGWKNTQKRWTSYHLTTDVCGWVEFSRWRGFGYSTLQDITIRVPWAEGKFKQREYFAAIIIRAREHVGRLKCAKTGILPVIPLSIFGSKIRLIIINPVITVIIRVITIHREGILRVF